MKLWLSHHAGVPLRDQLVRQIQLGILAGELKAGERLPSTRELGRRFKLHPNTVSAAYRELEGNGWLESRKGSGVYVLRNGPPRKLTPALLLDGLVADLIRSAGKAGIAEREVREHLQRWLGSEGPQHLLLIEPDAALAEIVAAELKPILRLPLRICARIKPAARELRGALVLTLPSKEAAVREHLPAGVECRVLRIRSVPVSLARWLPAPEDVLVGVASGWREFLASARTLLLAAGIHRDAMVLCDTRARGWQGRLRGVAAVVCDTVTAARVPPGIKTIVFPLLAEATLEELRGIGAPRRRAAGM